MIQFRFWNLGWRLNQQSTKTVNSPGTFTRLGCGARDSTAAGVMSGMCVKSAMFKKYRSK
jgi:hypothetical protein